MRGATQHTAARERAFAVAPALLRLAHQLTGNPDTAEAAVVRAMSARHAWHAHTNEALIEEQLTRELLRSLPRGAEPTTSSLLDRLPRRARIAATLAFGNGWDAEGIADVSRMSSARVRTAVGEALAVAPQEKWEQLLAAPYWALPTPSSLSVDVAGAVRRRQGERRLQALGAAGLAVALLATLVAVVRVATAPTPAPAVAHEQGLLSWPPRGDLVRDGALVSDAKSLWRRAPSGPTGKVYVLWAGHVGVGRLVVLQARDKKGTPSVAVVADHDVTFRHTVLRLDLVDELDTSGDPPWLAIPYDGNLNVAGLQSGPSQQVVQMLVRPDIDRITERSSTSLVSPPDERPSFRDQPLTAGLSQPWLVVHGDQPTSVVRAWSRGRQVETAELLDLTSVAPFPVHLSLTEPPAAWAGLPRSLSATTLADDALWWAQVCHSVSATVSLVWVSPRPPAARVEFVACPGAQPVAQVLLDAPGGTQWTGTFAVARSAIIVDLLNGPTISAVAVVGDKSVAHIEVGSTKVDGRWALVPASGVTVVRVSDAHGRQLIP